MPRCFLLLRFCVKTRTRHYSEIFYTPQVSMVHLKSYAFQILNLLFLLVPFSGEPCHNLSTGLYNWLACILNPSHQKSSESAEKPKGASYLERMGLSRTPSKQGSNSELPPRFRSTLSPIIMEVKNGSFQYHHSPPFSTSMIMGERVNTA